MKQRILHTFNAFLACSVLTLIGSIAIFSHDALASSMAGTQSSMKATFGQPGTALDVDRTMEIVATDVAFDRQYVKVKRGETIRFVIRNDGEIYHEFSIGTPITHQIHQDEMAEMMDHGWLMDDGEHAADRNDPHEGMSHSKLNTILIAPNEVRELIWKFEKANDVEFACNIPGHYEAGMVGNVKFL